MSDSLEPLPWVYVVVNPAGRFVGVPCETSLGAWCWMMNDRNATSEQLKEWGYSVRKYLLEQTK